MSTDAHSRPTGDAPEPLYDLNVATPTHAERARTLVSRISTGTLCTLAAEPEGFPYGSFVTVAFDNGHPVFLVSTMAEHTRNLQRDSRASLLVAETLLGPCTRVEGDGGSARATFLETHPNAAYYVDFGDFGFWRLKVESIRYIGGYGRMSWVEAADWQAAEPDPLAETASDIVTHMNDDHADAMVLYCRAFSKATEISAATMTGVDRYGFEMSAETAEGPRPVRLMFPQPVGTSGEVRTALVTMLKMARTTLEAKT